MKLKQVRAWLDVHLSIIDYACASNAAGELRCLQKIFDYKPNGSVKELCSLMERISVPEEAGNSKQEAYESFALMVLTLKDFGKAASYEELHAFEIALSRHRHASIAAFVTTVEEALKSSTQTATRRTPVAGLEGPAISSYVKQLEDALGDEAGFKDVFASLSSDPRLKAPDAKSIAKRFAAKAGKSKTEAMNLIWERHSSLLSSRARAKATAGRSAA